MSGSKRQTTVLSRLREFFERNPYEELSIEDMAIKFDCSTHAVRDAMRHLDIELERVIYYRRKDAGPKC